MTTASISATYRLNRTMAVSRASTWGATIAAAPATASIPHQSPLARWGIEQAKARVLDGSTVFATTLRFKDRTLVSLCGKVGWLTVKLISVETFGNQDLHLWLPRARPTGRARGSRTGKTVAPARDHRKHCLFNAPDATLLADVRPLGQHPARCNARNTFFEQKSKAGRLGGPT